MTDIYTGEITAVTDRNQEIIRELWEPCFWDERFDSQGSRTIFLDPSLAIEAVPGATVKGLNYCSTKDIEDRLNDGYAALLHASQKAIALVGNDCSAAYAEAMLQIAFNSRKLWVGHIVAGYIESKIAGPVNGYAYREYGYRGKLLPKTKHRS